MNKPRIEFSDWEKVAPKTMNDVRDIRESIQAKFTLVDGELVRVAPKQKSDKQDS